MNTQLKKSLPMGFASAVIYLIVGILAVSISSGEGYSWLLLTNPIAGFVSGLSAWWLFVVRRDRAGIVFPALAGAITGFLGHYINWYLLLAGAGICNSMTGGCTGSLGDAPMNPLEAFAGAAVYAMISLLFVGWFTIPAEAGIGILLAKIQDKSKTSVSK